MASLNRVTLIGHLGKDPEGRFLPDGTAVTNISIATTESWKDKSSGEKKERTEWHRIGFFGRIAEVAAEYLKKGSQVYIEGSIRTRKWKDQEGVDRFMTEIAADRMLMLGAKPGSEGNGRSASTSSARPTGAAAPAAAKKGGGSFDDMDDDIPF